MEYLIKICNLFFGWIVKVFTLEVKDLFFEIVSLYPN